MGSNDDEPVPWHGVGPGRPQRSASSGRSGKRGPLRSTSGSDELEDVASPRVVEWATAVLEEWLADRFGATVLRATAGSAHSVQFELRAAHGRPMSFELGWVYPRLVDLPGVERIVHRYLDDALANDRLDGSELYLNGVEYDLGFEPGT